jgi:hypothetical protein
MMRFCWPSPTEGLLLNRENSVRTVHARAVFYARDLCCRPILFIPTSRHDLQRVIRQRPLQHLRLSPRRAHPNVTLLVGRQYHRHGLKEEEFRITVMWIATQMQNEYDLKL